MAVMKRDRPVNKADGNGGIDGRIKGWGKY